MLAVLEPNCIIQQQELWGQRIFTWVASYILQILDKTNFCVPERKSMTFRERQATHGRPLPFQWWDRFSLKTPFRLNNTLGSHLLCSCLKLILHQPGKPTNPSLSILPFPVVMCLKKLCKQTMCHVKRHWIPELNARLSRLAIITSRWALTPIGIGVVAGFCDPPKPFFLKGASFVPVHTKGTSSTPRFSNSSRYLSACRRAFATTSLEPATITCQGCAPANNWLKTDLSLVRYICKQFQQQEVYLHDGKNICQGLSTVILLFCIADPPKGHIPALWFRAAARAPQHGWLQAARATLRVFHPLWFWLFVPLLSCYPKCIRQPKLPHLIDGGATHGPIRCGSYVMWLQSSSRSVHMTFICSTDPFISFPKNGKGLTSPELTTDVDCKILWGFKKARCPFPSLNRTHKSGQCKQCWNASCCCKWHIEELPDTPEWSLHLTDQLQIPPEALPYFFSTFSGLKGPTKC